MPEGRDGFGVQGHVDVARSKGWVGVNETCALPADQLCIVCQVGECGGLLEDVKQSITQSVVELGLGVDSAAQHVVAVPVGWVSTPALNLGV